MYLQNGLLYIMTMNSNTKLLNHLTKKCGKCFPKCVLKQLYGNLSSRVYFSDQIGPIESGENVNTYEKGIGSHKLNRSEKSEPEGEAKLQKSYKHVMRAVPQPVVVVTAALRKDDTLVKRGVTCSSFTSISLHPPIISFCMNRPSRMHNLLAKAQRFAVHVLMKTQVNYGIHFSKPAEEGRDQFENVTHSLSEKDVPIINHTAAVLECKAHSVLQVGDHNVWYGEVVNAHSNGTTGEPLLYYARSYWSLGDEMFMQAFEQTTLPFEEWTHEAHLRMAYNYIIEHGKDAAVPYIKNGIRRYNEQNKEKIQRGYHETVTMFYVSMVAAAIHRFGDSIGTTFDEFIQSNRHLMDRDLLFQYYSQERISCKEAFTEFILPDKKILPE